MESAISPKLERDNDNCTETGDFEYLGSDSPDQDPGRDSNDCKRGENPRNSSMHDW